MSKIVIKEINTGFFIHLVCQKSTTTYFTFLIADISLHFWLCSLWGLLFILFCCNVMGVTWMTNKLPGMGLPMWHTVGLRKTQTLIHTMYSEVQSQIKIHLHVKQPHWISQSYKTLNIVYVHTHMWTHAPLHQVLFSDRALKTQRNRIGHNGSL